MRHVLSAYRLFNILSLDVALGAVCSSLFFADIFHIVILPFGLVALALTVWIIYTVDHLRDAKSIVGVASTERHRFHQRYFKQLVLAVLITSVITIVLLFFARTSVVQWGIVLAVIAGMYLFIHKFLPVAKELFVAIIYTAGILLPSIAVVNGIENFWTALLVFQFGIVALLNLVIFSWFDYENDVIQSQQSFVIITGKHFTMGFIVGLVIIDAILSSTLIAFSWLRYESILLLLMTFVLLALISFRKYFAVNERYRLVGDAVFFLPLFMWVWHRI